MSEHQWLNPEDVVLPEDAPVPQLWRMLVAPVRPRRMSKGGIELPDGALDNQEMLTNVGKVMAMGSMVGTKPDWPQGAYNIGVGDWVIFGQYAGMRFEYRGVKLLLINDDEVLAKASGPEGFRIYI